MNAIHSVYTLAYTLFNDIWIMLYQCVAIEVQWVKMMDGKNLYIYIHMHIDKIIILAIAIAINIIIIIATMKTFKFWLVATWNADGKKWFIWHSDCIEIAVFMNATIDNALPYISWTRNGAMEKLVNQTHGRIKPHWFGHSGSHSHLHSKQ